MSVTIKDIAKAANVSATTVSRVVNNRPAGVSDAKREEIKHLIEEMHYLPNSNARDLITKRSHTLGIILPNIVDPFFAEIARGAQDTAETLGYIAILINSDDDRAKEKRAVEILKEQCVAGIMLYASGKLQENEWKELRSLGGSTPVVLAGHNLPHADTPTVFLDYRKGMGRMSDMLLEKGHRNIIYMSGMSTDPGSNEGILGYYDALERAGIGREKGLLRNGDFTLEGAKAEILKLLDLGVPFTAVLCENDLMAAGVLEALDERGIEVPGKVSVAGFDNTFFSRLTNPKLTTLGFPKYELGQESIRLLLKLLDKGTAFDGKIELDGPIIERFSIGKLME